MQKFIAILSIFTIVLTSCNETKFTPNTDNELLVGTWNIDEVDNSAALVSATEFMHSIIDEKFQANNQINFSAGADFKVQANENETATGQYEIGAENKTVSLKIENVIYGYDLVEKGNNTYQLNANTAGQTTNLTISKK